MRILLTIVVYVASLLLVTAVAAPLVLVLAGPHSDLLPGALQPAVLVLGWLCVLVVPVLFARRLWRRDAERARRGGATPS